MSPFIRQIRKTKESIKQFVECYGHRIYWIIVAAVIVPYGWAINDFVIAPPRSVASITAITESAEVTEPGGQAGLILLSSAWLTTDADAKGVCANGTFEPTAGSTLIVTRQGSERLTAQIQPGADGRSGILTQRDGAIHTYRQAVNLVFDPKIERCKPQPLLRIPIAGPTTLGTDYSPQSDPMTPVFLLEGGQVQTFARAADHFMFWPIRSLEGGLFPTGSVTLPAGARLRECAPSGQRVAWLGYAQVRTDSTFPVDRDINVVAFTEARRLSLTMPGGEKTGGVDCEGGKYRQPPGSGLAVREDVLQVSLLARMINDPILGAVAFSIGALFLVLPVMIALHSLALSKRDLKKTKST